MSDLLSIEKISPKKWIIAKHALYSESKRVVDWTELLPREKGTKHQREQLRKSAREFFYCWTMYMEGYTKKLSPATVQLMYTRLKTFILWMTSRDIWKFSSLTEAELLDFLRSRKAAKRSNNFDEVKNSPSKSILKNYITMFSLMWSFRESYTSPINFNAKWSAAFDEILLFAQPRKRWEPIENTSAIGLLSKACSKVETFGQLDTILRTIWAGSRALVGKTKYQRRTIVEILLKSSMLQYASSFSAEETVPTANCERPINEYIKELVGVSLIIILFFTGMRISEVLSLTTNCLIERVHSNGQRFWYLRGIAAKKGGVERLWVVPDIVVKVVQFQEDLFNRIRIFHRVNHLFLARIWWTSRLTGKTRPQALCAASASRLLKETINDIYEINFGLSLKFHPHRARKTFAKFVVLRDKSSLESMAHHYGHIYAATLDSQYVGNDFDLGELIREEDAIELRRGLLDLLSSTNLAGKAGERIVSLRNDQFSEIFKGKLSLETLVERMIRGGVVLAPCDWGYCVYSKDLSLCGGSRSGPDPVRRAPTVCASCSNFAVADRHVSWWERRHSDAENFLANTNISAQTRRIVEEQKQKSRMVLSTLVRGKGACNVDE